VIQKLDCNNKKYHPYLLDFINQNFDYDFYFTEENVKVYPIDKVLLKKFFKNCPMVFVDEDIHGYKGIIAVWKAHGVRNRHHVKIIAKDDKTTDNLITVLFWNYYGELFCKVKKTSRKIPILTRKGFRVQPMLQNETGNSVLLRCFRINKNPTEKREYS